MLCSLLALFISMSCGADEPHPTPTPSPTASPTPSPTPELPERIRASTDGKSMWEYTWERMTGQKFDRDAADNDDLVYDANRSPVPCPRGFFNDDDEFIPFSSEQRAACEENN